MTTSNIQAIKSQIEELQAKYASLNSDLQDKQIEQSQIEIYPYDHEEDYGMMLDECYGEFMGYSASNILKQVDRTAYHCGLIDYVDSKDVSDTEEYKELQEEIDDLETHLADIESDIEDLEMELEE